MLKLFVSAQEKLHAFKSNESGATAIEYGLIAAGIGLVVYAAATVLGTELTGLFSRIGAALRGT